MSEGVEKFGRYFRKKGWLGEEGVALRDKWWGLGEGGTRVVVEYVASRDRHRRAEPANRYGPESRLHMLSPKHFCPSD